MIKFLGIPRQTFILNNTQQTNILSSVDQGLFKIHVLDNPSIRAEIEWNGSILKVTWIDDSLVRDSSISNYLCIFKVGSSVIAKNNLGYNIILVLWSEF